MRVFGFSLFTLFLFLGFFVIGTKFPGALRNVPLLNRI